MIRFAIFLISVLQFINTARPALAAPELIDKISASVNSSLILHSDAEKFRKTMSLRSQLDPLFAGSAVASKGSSVSLNEITQFLIDERLITQAFPVSDSEVDQEINSIQSSNKIDRATLKTALQQQGYSFDDYFELIRVSASKRNLIDRDIRTKVTISEDDIKNYFYNQYSQKSSSARMYHLQMILVSTKNYKSQKAANEVAQRAADALKSGEAFEEVAKRFSDDPNAQTGGDLGTITEEQMAPVVRSNIQNLKIGQISPILNAAGLGFIILKMVDIKSDTAGKLDKVREEIRNHLANVEFQHQITLWIERQRQTAFIHRAGESSIAGLPSSMR